MLAITRQRQSTTFMRWAWTHSSRRSRPATAEWFRQRPEAGYPVSCPPGTGCGGSCGPNGVGNAMPCGWRRSCAVRRGEAGGTGLRPDQGGPGLPPVPAAGTGEGQRRVVPDLHWPQPAQAVPLRSTGPRMSMGHPANRAYGTSTPPVGNDVPCTEPPRVSIINRQESLTPIDRGLSGETS